MLTCPPKTSPAGELHLLDQSQEEQIPRRAFPVETIINLLREAEVFLGQGESLEAICRKLSITRQTYYRWRKICGGAGHPYVPNTC